MYKYEYSHELVTFSPFRYPRNASLPTPTTCPSHATLYHRPSTDIHSGQVCPEGPCYTSIVTFLVFLSLAILYERDTVFRPLVIT